MDLIDPIRIVLALAVLILASSQDLRERIAENWYWMLIGMAGLIFMVFTVVDSSGSWDYLLMVVAMFILFLEIFWDREEGMTPANVAVYLVPALLIAYLLATHWGEALLWSLMVVPLMYVFFVLLYMFDIIKGGADAKCLISLAILFPDYPSLTGLPLIAIPSSGAELILPFSLMVLFHAALLSMVVLLINPMINIRARDLRFPQMFLGYKVSLEKAGDGHYWPMEDVVDGERVLKASLQPDGERILRELAEMGAEDVWVTPKIPFLVPITAAFVFMLVIGNLIFLLA